MQSQLFSSNNNSTDCRPVGRVTLSPWVNEQLIPWNDILSARDVARLMRRKWWTRFALTCLGRFPRQKKYRGRAVGWLRPDVLEWMTRDLTLHSGTSATSHLGVAKESGLQHRLPLDGTPRHAHRRRRKHGARRGLGSWIDAKNGLSGAERAEHTAALDASTRSPRR
jgi:predicted DNA-binding transcriptional regulator AlpA